MRIIEIILKLAFLALSIYVIATSKVFGHAFASLICVAFILGIVLVFNKRESYRYPQNYPRMKNVYLTRRIEGVILIAFSVAFFIYVH